MKSILKAIRYPIFYVMLGLRGIFMLIARPIAVLFLFGAILIGVIYGLKAQVFICFAYSFGFFILASIYDAILLKINPTGITYILK